LLLLSGIVVPLTSLPSIIRRVAVALPPGAMAEGLHRVLGQGLMPTGTDWLVLGIWALLAPLVAARTFDSTKSFEGPQSRAPARPWGSPRSKPA